MAEYPTDSDAKWYLPVKIISAKIIPSQKQLRQKSPLPRNDPPQKPVLPGLNSFGASVRRKVPEKKRVTNSKKGNWRWGGLCKFVLFFCFFVYLLMYILSIYWRTFFNIVIYKSIFFYLLLHVFQYLNIVISLLSICWCKILN